MGLQGMERSTGPTLLDGSVGHNNWWYAIGSASTHNNGIPGPNSMAVYDDFDIILGPAFAPCLARPPPIRDV